MVLAIPVLGIPYQLAIPVLGIPLPERGIPYQHGVYRGRASRYRAARTGASHPKRLRRWDRQVELRDRRTVRPARPGPT